MKLICKLGLHKWLIFADTVAYGNNYTQTATAQCKRCKIIEQVERDL